MLLVEAGQFGLELVGGVLPSAGQGFVALGDAGCRGQLLVDGGESSLERRRCHPGAGRGGLLAGGVAGVGVEVWFRGGVVDGGGGLAAVEFGGQGCVSLLLVVDVGAGSGGDVGVFGDGGLGLVELVGELVDLALGCCSGPLGDGGPSLLASVVVDGQPGVGVDQIGQLGGEVSAGVASEDGSTEPGLGDGGSEVVDARRGCLFGGHGGWAARRVGWW